MKELFEQFTEPDNYRHLISKPSKANITRIKNFYKYAIDDLGYDHSVVNASLAFVLRKYKGKVPLNNILINELEITFGDCKNSSDAALRFQDLILIELDPSLALAHSKGMTISEFHEFKKSYKAIGEKFTKLANKK